MLPEALLTTAGYLRTRCAEACDWHCPECGSATSEPDANGAQCPACLRAVWPNGRCFRCEERVVPGPSGERSCGSVAVYRSRGLIAFRPSEPLWEYVETGQPLQLATQGELINGFRSGRLQGGILVKEEGMAGFAPALTMPAFHGVAAVPVLGTVERPPAPAVRPPLLAPPSPPTVPGPVPRPPVPAVPPPPARLGPVVKGVVLALLALAAAAAVLDNLPPPNPVSVTPPNKGPSFDCTLAASFAEEAVCGDSTLGARDRELSEVYQAAMTLGTKAAEIQETERAWIAARDQCTTKGCVELAYAFRIDQLRSGAGAGWASPPGLTSLEATLNSQEPMPDAPGASGAPPLTATELATHPLALEALQGTEIRYASMVDSNGWKSTIVVSYRIFSDSGGRPWLRRSQEQFLEVKRGATGDLGNWQLMLLISLASGWTHLGSNLLVTDLNPRSLAWRWIKRFIPFPVDGVPWSTPPADTVSHLDDYLEARSHTSDSQSSFRKTLRDGTVLDLGTIIAGLDSNLFASGTDIRGMDPNRWVPVRSTYELIGPAEEISLPVAAAGSCLPGSPVTLIPVLVGTMRLTRESADGQEAVDTLRILWGRPHLIIEKTVDCILLPHRVPEQVDMKAPDIPAAGTGDRSMPAADARARQQSESGRGGSMLDPSILGQFAEDPADTNWVGPAQVLVVA